MSDKKVTVIDLGDNFDEENYVPKEFKIEQIMQNIEKSLLRKSRMEESIEKMKTLGIRKSRMELAVEKMQNSGVPWIGEIPEDWKLVKLKLLTSKIGSGKTPKGGCEVYSKTGVTFLRSQNIHNNGLVLDDVAFISEELDKELLNTRLQLNDVLLNITGGSIGRVCIWTLEKAMGNVNQHVCIIRENGSYSHKLIHFLFMSKIGERFIEQTQTGANREGLNFENIGNFPIPVPPISLQQKITQFLDKKITTIDKLIFSYEKLLVLLAEKRQAIISEAVTKGLEPYAPMKDSGVDWIGEIPVGWEVKKLKYVLKSERGSMRVGPFGSHLKGDDFKTEGYPVFNQRTVLDNNFSNGDVFVNEEKYNELKGFSVDPNDILLTTRGTIGKIAIAPDDVATGIIHPCIIKFSVETKKILHNFLSYIFNDTDLLFKQFQILSNATTIAVIYSEVLKNVCFSLPPLEVQEQIVQYLDEKTSKIDQITADTKEQIALLKEYRQSLISEVVTGKVEV